ncbi:MAG: chemotaxis protein CheD [Candidatus Neomarinimicrobiota bacterium]|nr:chemotaxis protein CheD [Candidatus Neomarinimicrobiota bacterium]RKY50332.1 MAG: chemotaxis protein CheD [Candidatus Neomarinimicrobiota bacterium]
MVKVVEIADMKWAVGNGNVLITYALGSCIGVVLYDPVEMVGAMLHSMLPLSRSDPDKARKNPYMYTDIGVELLLRKVFDLGATRKNLVAKVAGGANLLDDKRFFRIGEKNYMVVRKILWKNNILISGEDVGGSKPRTMVLDMSTWRVTIRSGEKEYEI